MVNNSSQGDSSYSAIEPEFRRYSSLSNFCSVFILFRCFSFTIPSAYNSNFEGLLFLLSLVLHNEKASLNISYITVAQNGCGK